jgi:hypothetical protein
VNGLVGRSHWTVSRFTVTVLFEVLVQVGRSRWTVSLNGLVGRPRWTVSLAGLSLDGLLSGSWTVWSFLVGLSRWRVFLTVQVGRARWTVSVDGLVGRSR